MELPSKIFEQIALNTRPKISDHMLIVLKENTHKETFFEPLQTKKNQFEKTLNFLTVNNRFFNVTSKTKDIYFTTPNDNHKISIVTIAPGAYELENLNDEIFLRKDTLKTEVIHFIQIKFVNSA